MAAPTTLAILNERLYAIGVEAAELRDACVAPPAEQAGLDGIAKVLDRFVRDFHGPAGRGVAATNVSADFAARSATEAAAHVTTIIDTSDSTAAITSLTAVILAAGLDGDIETEAID